MLKTRMSALAKAGRSEEGDVIPDDAPNPVGDTEFGHEADNAPTQVVERADWSDHQRRQLRDFGERLQQLSGAEHDRKLAATARQITAWLTEPTPFCPVVFCRYIETAKYVGEHLEPLLRKQFPKLDLQVITSELPDELRKQRIDVMGRSKLRVLIATDCLSEGINLQDQFTAVLHYDLPWNPNRLEQREGRVDRFGQVAPVVKACLLYGADNPIDGVVLDVLLRKVREIKRSTGINVPFPEDSQSIIDTITQALLLNPSRVISTQQSVAGHAVRLLPTSKKLRPRKTRSRASSTTQPSARRPRAPSLPSTPSRRTRSRPTCARWTRRSATPRPWKPSSPAC